MHIVRTLQLGIWLLCRHTNTFLQKGWNRSSCFWDRSIFRPSQFRSAVFRFSKPISLIGALILTWIRSCGDRDNVTMYNSNKESMRQQYRWAISTKLDMKIVSVLRIIAHSENLPFFYNFNPSPCLVNDKQVDRTHASGKRKYQHAGSRRKLHF